MLEHNYARKQVRRIARNTIIWMLILAAAVTAVLVLKSANPVNLYLKDAPVSTMEDVEGSYDHSLNWVEVNADYMDLWYTLSKDGKVTSRYYFWYTDDGGFVCVRSNTKTLTEEDFENFTFTGYVTNPNEDDREAVRRFVKELKSQFDMTEEEARSWVSPYVIYASSPRIVHQVITGAGYLFILFALWKIIRAVAQIGDYRKSKSYKKLGLDDDERERVNTQVSDELAKDEFIIDHGTTKVTGRWIVQNSANAFSVRSMGDLIWVYGSVTQHRTNGIPTGKTHAITLGFTDGTFLSIPVKKEEQMRELIDRIYQLQGDRVFGFDDELKKMFHNDREAFISLARRAGAKQREDAAMAGRPQGEAPEAAESEI